MENEINQTDNEQIKTGWQLVPRKILGGLLAMLLIAQAAKELKELPFKQFVLVIICMGLLGFAAVFTYYLLERGPKEKKVKEEKKYISA